MSKKHDELLAKAIKAVENLFSDTSVSRKKTRESMEEVIEEIQMKIESLKDDDDE